MSFQIDIYGDRDKNREQTEKEEKKSDNRIKIILLAFMALLFIFYTKDMFTRTLPDQKSKVRIENHEDITVYKLDGLTITVAGQKDQENEAMITSVYAGNTTAYRLNFSNSSDWEHSLVTVFDEKGAEIYSKQYKGYSKAAADGSHNELSLSPTNKYQTLIALAFRKGTRSKINILLYTAACLLIIIEALSYKLWKWFFFRHRIKWAVDLDSVPSRSYRQTMLIGRFAVFILILYVIIQSYYI